MGASLQGDVGFPAHDVLDLHPQLRPEPPLITPQLLYSALSEQLKPSDVRVVYSLSDLPKADPARRRPRRSSYLYRYYYACRKRGYIYLNERWRGWEWALTYAHEIGHALDDYDIHPAQEMLGWKICCDYRAELAATSITLTLSLQLDLQKRADFVRRYCEIEREYLGESESCDRHPPLVAILRAMPSDLITLASQSALP